MAEDERVPSAAGAGSAAPTQDVGKESSDFVERLKAAVWMVGNMDTPQDKAAWWATFDPLWKEVAQDPRVQDYADREFHRAHEARQRGAAGGVRR